MRNAAPGSAGENVERDSVATQVCRFRHCDIFGLNKILENQRQAHPFSFNSVLAISSTIDNLCIDCHWVQFRTHFCYYILGKSLHVRENHSVPNRHVLFYLLRVRRPPLATGDRKTWAGRRDWPFFPEHSCNCRAWRRGLECDQRPVFRPGFSKIHEAIFLEQSSGSSTRGLRFRNLSLLVREPENFGAPLIVERPIMKRSPHAAGRKSYALVTAAYNEERFIEETIKSVIAQTLLPTMWAIVSDGCTDRTDEIVQRYAARYSFIRLLRRERDQNRGFASKVFALNAGVTSLPPGQANFFGVLDADIWLDPNYFAELMKRFDADPVLGLASGWVSEKIRGEYRTWWGNSSRSVPGAIQMFRFDCYRDIGGLLPIEYGGEDWYAEIMARKCGWRVRSFPELPVRHLRVTGSKGGRLRYFYREGITDFAFGSHPLFEIAKIGKRMLSRPYFVGAIARSLGFAVAHFTIQRIVPPDVVLFLRREELARLCSIPLLLTRGKPSRQELEPS